MIIEDIKWFINKLGSFHSPQISLSHGKLHFLCGVDFHELLCDIACQVNNKGRDYL